MMCGVVFCCAPELHLEKLNLYGAWNRREIAIANAPETRDRTEAMDLFIDGSKDPYTQATINNYANRLLKNGVILVGSVFLPW
jgi:predicted O-methyltransferase YrrM